MNNSNHFAAIPSMFVHQKSGNRKQSPNKKYTLHTIMKIPSQHSRDI